MLEIRQFARPCQVRRHMHFGTTTNVPVNVSASIFTSPGLGMEIVSRFLALPCPERHIMMAKVRNRSKRLPPQRRKDAKENNKSLCVFVLLRETSSRDQKV